MGIRYHPERHKIRRESESQNERKRDKEVRADIQESERQHGQQQQRAWRANKGRRNGKSGRQINDTGRESGRQ